MKKRIFSIVLLLVLLLSIIGCKTTEPTVIPEPEIVYVDVPVEISVEAIPFPYWDLKPVFDMALLLPSTETANVVQNNITLIGYQLHLETYLRLIQAFYDGVEYDSILEELTDYK